VIADIGNTSFVYDMRNIKEVFVFPKIWYRRSLARRLILGEETTTLIGGQSGTNAAGSSAKNGNFTSEQPSATAGKTSQLKSDSKNSFNLLNTPEQQPIPKNKRRKNRKDFY
jgi:hypothetical protein